MTYNSYLTEGIQNGAIKTITRDGVRHYLVRRPEPNEEVVHYQPLSAVGFDYTPTEKAGKSDK